MDDAGARRSVTVHIAVRTVAAHDGARGVKAELDTVCRVDGSGKVGVGGVDARVDNGDPDTGAGAAGKCPVGGEVLAAASREPKPLRLP